MQTLIQISCFTTGQFQSRNRDAFLFKYPDNLDVYLLVFYGFNLVIEMLFFSSFHWGPFISGTLLMFQSRNRDAFLFKPTPSDNNAPSFQEFQSRNRDAFLFK